MFLALTIAGLLAGQTAPPPQIPSGDSSTSVEDIVVDGRPLVERARDYVGEVAAPPRDASLAKWEGDICVGAVNLRNDLAQALVDRISSVAQTLGARPGEPGCDPRVIVVMTDDADGVAAQMVERWPRTFRPGVTGMARDEGDLEAFVASDAPVRWWHVSMTVDVDSGAPVMRMPGQGYRIIDRRVGASRLRSQYRDDMRKVFIVVDVDDVAEVSFEQLADYVTFIALAQVDPEGDTTGHDTILNLFRQSPPARLTGWDHAYLEALYKSDPSVTTPNRHDNQVAYGLARELRREQADNSPSSAPSGS